MQSITVSHTPGFGKIRVTCDAKVGLYDWEDALSQDRNFMEAVARHALRLGWAGEWHMGSLPRTKGYYTEVAVCIRRGGDQVVVHNMYEETPVIYSVLPTQTPARSIPA